jgi:hypothetical protein
LTGGAALPVFWSDGGRKPEGAALEVFQDRQIPPNGALFVGTESSLMLVHYGGRPYLLPLEKDRAFRHSAVPGNPQEQYSSFVSACLGEGKTTGGFDYAGHLAEATLLGTIAVRHPREKLLWDTAALRFASHPAATARVKPDYREGWKMAGI